MDLKGAEIRNFEGIICGQKKGNDSYERYRIIIPHYQRPYKWEIEHVKQLIEDWNQNNNENEDNQYFAGSIVTVRNDQTKQFDLIDGQQRFTTIFLINYLRFLLLRVMVRETNTQLSLQRRHDNLLASLIRSHKYLSNEDSNLEKYQKFSANPFNAEDMESELLKKFLEYSQMPVKEREEDGQIYFDKHRELLEEKFKNQQVILQYDRSYFNTILIDALSRISITLHSQLAKPKLNILKYHEDEKEIKEASIGYINAIKTIFDTFSSIIDDKIESNNSNLTSFTIAEKMVSEMDNFLENIQLCVIETGNTDDAYTLFEVLNDRSLALDNLDLLKNQFYRTFVLNNPSNDSEKDHFISKLDDQWYEQIFKKSLSESAKKLIVFLGVSYITGDDSLTIKQPDKFIRDAINNEYLKSFNDKQELYSAQQFQRDFNIFQACEIFLHEAGVKYRAEKNTAYQSAYRDSTILDKTIHLLKALKQETVLAGLFAYIFNYLKIRENITDFNPDKIRRYATQYLYETLPNEIYQQSLNIWMLAMKAKDYKPVLKNSSALLKNNNLSSDTLTSQEISVSVKQEVDSQFLNWLRTWTYSPSNTFKLRMLFARSLQLEMTETGELRKSKFRTQLDREYVLKLDVDHMEPVTINPDAPGLYFSDPDRESIINQLGNMMILTDSENRRKSNSPMEKVFESLKEAGLENHYLTLKTKEIFNDPNNHETRENLGHKIKVPNKEFFNQRKEFLIDIFNKTVDLPF